MTEKYNYGTRKVFPVSGNSIGIIIPTTLAKKMGLKKGDAIEFISNGEVTIKKLKE